MFNYLLFILLSNHLFISIRCLIIHTQRPKENEAICVKNHFRLLSTNNLHVCHINSNRNRSILIWFKIDQSLLHIFHSYRFILRSIDDLSLSTIDIHILTNFTEFVDLNNSLRVFNLDSGQYEICLDFRSRSTSYIYSPRNGCISIRIGEFLHPSFKQSSAQLFVALIISIILFLLLGLVVQWMKNKQIRQNENKTRVAKEHLEQQRSRSASIFSSVSPKKQCDRFARKLFRRHIDQPDPSRMRQWARNRAFRHRIATQQHEIQSSRSVHQWNKHVLTTSTKPTLTTDDIYVIPMHA